MYRLDNPLLVVSYTQKTRDALRANLDSAGVAAIYCASFRDAEMRAISTVCPGIIVDITSMVKARGEEKIVACTLTGLYPTLRVRSDGLLLGPGASTDGIGQSSSLSEFIRSCATLPPKILRAYRRHKITVSMLVIRNGEEMRSFSGDLSWGGAFLADVQPEQKAPGEQIDIVLPEFRCTVSAEIRWIQPWGGRFAAGYGVQFGQTAEPFETALGAILNTSRETDRARLVA